MKAKHNTTLQVRQIWDAWMSPAEHLTMDEAVEKLKELGNEILEVDKKNRKIKVLHVDSDDERWICDYCPMYSRSEEVIIKHEATHRKEQING